MLIEIENQTDYLFLYNRNHIDLSKNITVNVKNMQVSELLKELQVDYVMEGSHIILVANSKEAQDANSRVSQQSIPITGM